MPIKKDAPVAPLAPVVQTDPVATKTASDEAVLKDHLDGLVEKVEEALDHVELMSRRAVIDGRNVAHGELSRLTAVLSDARNGLKQP